MDLNIFRKPKSVEDAAALQKTQKLFFWISLGVVAMVVMLGDNMSDIGGLLFGLIAVPFCIWLGMSAFSDAHVSNFKLHHCVCGELITYNEDVTYHVTKPPRKSVYRDTKNGDITTDVDVDLIIEYTCPKCQQIRRYSTRFTIESMKQTAFGVVLSHNKYTLRKEDVEEKLNKNIRSLTLLEDSQV